ncbi:hypothetical protein P8C59_004495 [Phyllachora maydis]|uniref:Uncharacterized protein n=1 Tax=Phyllachora maydis TaxID=1825666 RepID=A0AAD9I2T5_9PEZI|nr:hypothetical protein P8C59_004495 [Phyllachora maydis]
MATQRLGSILTHLSPGRGVSHMGGFKDTTLESMIYALLKETGPGAKQARPGPGRGHLPGQYACGLRGVTDGAAAVLLTSMCIGTGMGVAGLFVNEA